MLVIGIAGGSGAGKTTVAKTIVNKLGDNNVALISQDWYYLDRSHMPMEQREQINLDHPDSFDNQLLLDHLHQLQKGNSIDVPTYDYLTHTRTPKTVPLPVKPVIVIEGILVLAEKELRSVMDIKVFVDTDPDIRLIRRLTRDIKERNSTLETVIERYVKTVKPMHEAFIEPSKRHADIIIPKGGENKIGIELLTSEVEHYLSNQLSL